MPAGVVVLGIGAGLEPGGAVTVKGALVTEACPAFAVSVRLPACSAARLVKVAKPLTIGALVVPVMALELTVTGTLLLSTMLPKASKTCTCTGGITWLTAPPAGGVTNTRRLG